MKVTTFDVPPTQSVNFKLKMKVRPINGWVLIKKIEREEQKTSEGVILPGGGRSSRGIVLGVAEEIKNIKEGDTVIFTNFPIELEDLEEVTGNRDLKLVRHEEVYAVIEPDALWSAIGD